MKKLPSKMKRELHIKNRRPKIRRTAIAGNRISMDHPIAVRLNPMASRWEQMDRKNMPRQAGNNGIGETGVDSGLASGVFLCFHRLVEPDPVLQIDDPFLPV